MKDICLIYLPKPWLKEPDAQAPIGILYLAAILKENNYDIELKNYSIFSDEKAIKDLPESKLFGITVTSLELLQANRFSEKIKKKYPNSKIILGGPGVYSKEYIDFNFIDSILIGEGETTILDVMKDIYSNSLKKEYIGIPVKDLDSIPYPARYLLKDKQGGFIFADRKTYADSSLSTIILSSRGCPFKCAFCTAPALTYSNKFRFREPKEVAKEIQHVKKEYGISQFRFSDDMFTVSRKRVFELCEEIGKEDVFWRISCRVKPLDDDMLKAMYEAGCRELSFGIESFDDVVLTGLNKKTTCKENVDAIIKANKYGFNIRMLFMIRTPFQTEKTVSINKYWIKRVPYSLIACTGFIPIPGSDIWNNPDKYNIEILDNNLDKYNFYMFGPDGRRKLDKIIKIKDRDLDEFYQESEEFRDWLEDYAKVNKG